MNAIPSLEHLVRIALIFAAIFCTAAGAIALCCAVAPRLVRGVAAGGAQPRFAALRGLAIMLALALVALVLRGAGHAGIAASILIVTPVGALGIAGYAGVMLRLGRAVLRFHRGEPSSDLLAALCGHAVMLFAVHIPVLGWAAFMYAVLHGLGVAAGEVLSRGAAALRGRPLPDEDAAARTTERG